MNNLPTALTHNAPYCSIKKQHGGTWYLFHYKRVPDGKMGYAWEFDHQEPAPLCTRCNEAPAAMMGLCDNCLNEIN